jgi:hypothetical protein
VLREVADDEESSIDHGESFDMSRVADDSIVHQAMGIPHRFLQVSSLVSDEYYSSAEMSVEAQQEFVDPILYKALGWFVDEELYAEAADIADVEPANSKCLNIACDTVTLATTVASLKHLALAIRLHHNYGQNKASLASYYTEHMTEHAPAQQKDGQTLSSVVDRKRKPHPSHEEE